MINTLNGGQFSSKVLDALKRKPRRQTVDVLQVLLKSKNEWQYGYDIARKTGLGHSSVYAIMNRLDDLDFIEQQWKIEDEERPRHMFRLTDSGLEYANLAVYLFHQKETASAKRRIRLRKKTRASLT